MNLKKIRLNNFRQFYGDQVIEVAPPGEHNVTLIHAENGVGKTTLLNAVLWTFFGNTTKKFEQKEMVVNFEAWKEDRKTASVEITFEHEDNEYLAVRKHSVTEGGRNRIKFQVMRIEKNGVLSSPLPNPEAFINTVIPNAMAPYFFFDGEQAETFSSETNYKAIAAAIRDILGSTLIETAIGDLKYIARKFNEELGDIPGEEEITILESQISKLENGIDSRNSDINELDKNINAYQVQLKEIGDVLREAQAASGFQRQRDAKQQELLSVQSRLRDAESEVLRWVGTKSLSVISSKLANESLDYIDEESLRGRIPSPYNEEFVKGLLSAEKCVCERPLSPGTDEWRAVQTLLKSAANAEVMARVVRARARIGVLKEQREDAPRLLENAEKTIASMLERQNTLEREIEEIGKKLENLPVADIQQRERARKELEKKLDSAKAEKIRKQRDNEHDEDKISRLNKEVAELASQNQAAQRLVLRRDIAVRGGEILKKILEINETTAREEIQEKVNSILDQTARRHYQFELDDNFEVRLLLPDGRIAPKSSGENQLMSLAFIAALVQFAEKRSEEEKTGGLFIPATVAPLILDSPFGQLDESYRSDTASFVPEMAPQVILLVSSSQGKDEVMKALEGNLGAEYVLIAHNREAQGEKKEDNLEIGGQIITTTLFNQERGMTEIRKVEMR